MGQLRNWPKKVLDFGALYEMKKQLSKHEYDA